MVMIGKRALAWIAAIAVVATLALAKKKKYTRGDSVFYMSGTERTLASMPKYNAYQGKAGAHGSKKYDRRKADRDFRRDMLDS